MYTLLYWPYFILSTNALFASNSGSFDKPSSALWYRISNQTWPAEMVDIVNVTFSYSRTQQTVLAKCEICTFQLNFPSPISGSIVFSVRNTLFSWKVERSCKTVWSRVWTFMVYDSQYVVICFADIRMYVATCGIEKRSEWKNSRLARTDDRWLHGTRSRTELNLLSRERNNTDG